MSSLTLLLCHSGHEGHHEWYVHQSSGLPMIRMPPLSAFRPLRDSLLVLQRFEVMADVSIDVHLSGSEIGVDRCIVCMMQHRNCSCWVFLYPLNEVVQALVSLYPCMMEGIDCTTHNFITIPHSWTTLACTHTK